MDVGRGKSADKQSITCFSSSSSSRTTSPSLALITLLQLNMGFYLTSLLLPLGLEGLPGKEDMGWGVGRTWGLEITLYLFLVWNPVKSNEKKAALNQGI